MVISSLASTSQTERQAISSGQVTAHIDETVTSHFPGLTLESISNDADVQDVTEGSSWTSRDAEVDEIESTVVNQHVTTLTSSQNSIRHVTQLGEYSITSRSITSFFKCIDLLRVILFSKATLYVEDYGSSSVPQLFSTMLLLGLFFTRTYCRRHIF